MSNQDLFGQTYTQILAKVVGGENQNFQMVYPFMDWWWPVAPFGQIAPQAYAFANTVPQWSALAQFNPTDASFFSRYRELLYQVNLAVSPDKRQRLKDALDGLQDAQNIYQNHILARNTAWVTMINNLPKGVPAPDFTTWEIASGWAATLQTDGQIIAKRQETVANIVGQENPEYTAAMQATTPPADKDTKKPGWTVMNQGDGNLVSVPMYFIGKSGQDWVDELTKGGTAVHIDLRANLSSQALSQSWAGGNASYGNPFWGVYGGGSWNSLDLSTEDQSLTATVDIKAANLVQVVPSDNWYNSGFLAKLARDPNAFNPPFKPTDGPNHIFGKEGLLPLRITALVVGYQPKFSITMSAATFNRHREEFQASGGFRIGPFRFGGSGGHVTDNWTKKLEGTTFSGESNATYPFIMGVLVATPGIDTH